jgi:hypothetical protein
MGTELLLAIIIGAVMLVLMVIMFLMGFKEALRTKVVDPIKIEEFYAGEGWDDDTLRAYEIILEKLHRELNDEEQRYFMELVEEGYKGDLLVRKFLEFSRQFKEHH